MPLTAGHAPAELRHRPLRREAVDFLRTAPEDRAVLPALHAERAAPPVDPAAPARGCLRRPDAAAPAELRRADPGEPPWIRELPPIDAVTARRLDAEDPRTGDTARRRRRRRADRRRGRGPRRPGSHDDLLPHRQRASPSASTAGGPSPAPTRNAYGPRSRARARPGGRHGPQLVSNVDLAPTIASLAGVAAAPTDGVDLAPLLTGGPAPFRHAVLLEYDGDPVVPAWQPVMTADLAYIRTGDARGAVRPHRRARGRGPVRDRRSDRLPRLSRGEELPGDGAAIALISAVRG